MFKQIVNSALTPIMRRLDANKQRALGIRSTMQIAKRYNRWMHGDELRERTQACQTIDELLNENGSQVADPGLIEDGFLLDTSRKLPHIDEVLADSEEVIAQRGMTSEADDRYRAFFRNLIDDQD